ncbi:MAG: peptidoglycan editing factor PgeF [Chromatiales bacterium]|nr:peptidoglycan editing factor PgeF [Chromatiales bacterium]
MHEWIVPSWPVGDTVKAVITTRAGGFSQAPYDSLNLGDHVGDDPAVVARNRAFLKRELALPGEPNWLTQVHGCDVVPCGSGQSRADAVITDQPGQVCAVLTADCLPVLIADRAGRKVAAVHAGWRGLSAGVIENAVHALALPGEELLAWLGPAIGPAQFEVGAEVREVFIQHNPAAEAAFVNNRPGHWLADIYQLARLRLNAFNLSYVGGGEYCTVSDQARFFSYRRDGVTGRMAALIWIESKI